MRLPSVKTICDAFPYLGRADAELLRGILRGDTHPRDYPHRFHNTLVWILSCYHKPSHDEVKMNAANELLRGHGVEAVFQSDEFWPWLEYVNLGSLYTPTLCRLDGRYLVASWGDIVERDKRAQS